MKFQQTGRPPLKGSTMIRQMSLLSVLLLACSIARSAEPQFDDAQVTFFEARIRPLLAENCFTCHSADTKPSSGLRVDDRNGLVLGGDRGAAIVPGKSAESLLVKAVSHSDDDLKMPPGKQLSPEQIADLSKWIDDGAAWPAPEEAYELGADNPEYEAKRKNHWAWQPLKEQAPPRPAAMDWVRSDIDAFVLARLEQENLRPVGDADRLTLLRRVTFDLTGLPPSQAEIDAFLADRSPTAFEKVVDRLLASPAYGEHWGRHWLDVARFGESTGSSRNLPYPHAWRFRDYVIAAFNADKPFDQFVREQIAGDLLPTDNQQQRDEQRIATGFLALGVKDVNQRFKVRFVMDNIDEQIDAVSRAFLAVTASCARCHDHKFDPIPTADYYALAGIFHSTDLCAGVRNKMGGGGLDYYDTQMILQIGVQSDRFEPSPEVAENAAALKKSIAEAQAEFVALRGKPEGNEPGPDGRPKRQIARQKVNKLKLELRALTDPVANGGQAAFGVREAAQIADTQVRVRGEAEQLGATVPRGFLSLLPLADAQTIPEGQSGRLQLAQWLTSPNNPLTPRVIVNRVWHHLFGRGIVSSVDNFGINGDVPSHPELLDYLAGQFAEQGWSVKQLVRSLVLSRTYGLASDAADTNVAADPLNRLVWRHSPRRLAAEELRDAMLAATGALDRSSGVGSAGAKLPVVEIRNNGPEATELGEVAFESKQRSVYLPQLRGITPRSLAVFDFIDQGMVAGSRDATTVAPQALYMLNDPLVRRQSLVLAEQLLADSASDDRQRVDRAFRAVLHRAAVDGEIERALAYLNEYQALSSELPPAAPLAQDGEVSANLVPASDGAAVQIAGAAQKKPPANPDEADQTDMPVNEVVVEASTPVAAAWASLCQALLASAEFRFLQ